MSTSSSTTRVAFTDIAGAFGAIVAALCCAGTPLIVAALAATGLSAMRKDAILWRSGVMRMWTHQHAGWIAPAAGIGIVVCAACSHPAVMPRATRDTSMIAIQSYGQALAGIHAANPAITVSIGRDAALRGEPVLLIEYPESNGNPASRDIWCNAEHTDWSTGHAITFQVKSANVERLSVSFMDRNHVAYTTWIDLEAGTWQRIRIPFDQLRPNPYFQPPDAQKGNPIDVSNVTRLGFAPQKPTAGRLAVSKIVVTQ